MENKLQNFLQTEEYENIKDIFIDKLSDHFFIDAKMIPLEQVENNVAKLCDAFLLNCINKMHFETTIEQSSNTSIQDYYKKWIAWIQQNTKIQSGSLQDAVIKLETIIEHAGNQVYEGLSKDAPPKLRAKVIDNIAAAFIAIVQFLLALGLDPVDVLSASIFDCELEEYGAMMHLVDNVLYKIDTSCDAINCLNSLHKKDLNTYAEFIGALHEIWGTFNIFYVKKGVCSPAVFEKKLMEIIQLNP